jgi:DNA-directed RNA polymerase subunit M/transcription elongation factor TFIIS
VARDWSKQRKRDLARQALGAEIELARILRNEDEPQPSKAEQRAEAAALLAAYQGPIKKLPTVVALRCAKCGHRGNVRMRPGEPKRRFKCSKCGYLAL